MTGMIDSREASDKYDTWLSLDRPTKGVWDTYKGIPVNCPVGLEERSKMMLICLTFPSIFRMFKGIPHATWETSLHKTACEKECKFLLRRYCCTDESAAATLTLDPDDKYNEDVLDFMDSTPFDQERRHWACTLLIVDTMVSLTCKESGTKVDLTRVTEFVDMIANCHKDMKDYTDKSMVNVLGKEMNDFYHILEFSALNVSTFSILGLLWCRFHQLSDSEVVFLRSPPQGEKKRDQAPVGLLHWNVFNGHLRDLAAALVAYGVNPKCDFRKKMGAYCPQMKTFNKSLNAGRAPSQELKKEYAIIKKVLVAKDKYAKTLTENCHIREDKDTAEAPSVAAYAALLYSASRKQNHFHRKSIDDEEVPQQLMHGIYLGNNSGTAMVRYTKIIFVQKQSWTFGTFARLASGSQPRSFTDHCYLFFGAHIRDSLTDAKKEEIAEKCTRLRRNIAVLGDWKLLISENTRIHEGGDDTIESTPKAATKAEKISAVVSGGRALEFMLESGLIENMDAARLAFRELCSESIRDLYMETKEGKAFAKKAAKLEKDGSPGGIVVQMSTPSQDAGAKVYTSTGKAIVLPDSLSLDVQNSIRKVQRQFNDDDASRSIGEPMTSSSNDTVEHLVRTITNDQIHMFEIGRVDKGDNSVTFLLDNDDDALSLRKIWNGIDGKEDCYTILTKEWQISDVEPEGTSDTASRTVRFERAPDPAANLDATLEQAADVGLKEPLSGTDVPGDMMQECGKSGDSTKTRTTSASSTKRAPEKQTNESNKRAKGNEELHGIEKGTEGGESKTGSAEPGGADDSSSKGDHGEDSNDGDISSHKSGLDE